MIDVLIIAAVVPERNNLVAAVRQLKNAGARVRMACAFDPAVVAVGGKMEVHRLNWDLRRLRNGRQPRRFSPGWAWLVARNIVIRWRIKRAPVSVRTWLLARYDPWIQDQASTADVVVALEQRAVFTAWQLARQFTETNAVLGLRHVLDALGDLWLVNKVADGRAVRAAEAARLPLAWNTVVETFRGCPSHLLPSIPRIVRRLRWHHAYAEAEAVGRSVPVTELSPDTASWLRLELISARLGAGSASENELADAVTEALAVSDAHLRNGDVAAASEIAMSVAEAVFHRELHAAVISSPLAEDPDSFLKPLRSSLTFRALAAPAGAMEAEIPGGDGHLRDEVEAPQSPTLASAQAAPHRLLVISDGNLHFAEDILVDLQLHASVEVRRLMLREQGLRFGRREPLTMISDRLSEVAGRPLPDLDLADAELLDWPDTVFVDWCDNAAMWASLHVPRHVRIVVRLHSIEAFSHQPHMMDWSRVSDVVFVGPHVRDFVRRAIPTMDRAGRIHVIPNLMQLDRFAQPKQAGADRVIAVVGWGQKVKDPVWALEVLARLRAHDDRWRMMLIGQDLAESRTTSGRRYRDSFREQVQSERVREGLIFVPQTNDLPNVLRRAGFILSASLRESFGVGLSEGAASAAVPVVRDWPAYRAYGGARAVFPAEWVVQDVEAAVRRILEHSDPDALREAGDEARKYVTAHFDQQEVASRYREVLLGTLDRQIPEASPRSTG